MAAELAVVVLFSGSIADVLLRSGCTPNHPFVNALPQRAVARACGPDTELSLCDHPAEGVRPNQGHVVPWSGQAAPESTRHLGLNRFAGVRRPLRRRTDATDLGQSRRSLVDVGSCYPEF